MMNGIYIHFPFCKQKCVYCNFYSVASEQLKEAYWQAVSREIELTANYLPDNMISTLYFGGGTPSLCNREELDNILQSIRRYYHFAPTLEFTLEANPEQLSPSYLKDIKSLGINRLSIGVQSFNDEILSLLNRRHTGKEAKKAIENAFSAGFENISIDLIYDIAYRSADMWRQDLQTASDYDIQHLSAYSLTVEENTLLARRVRAGQRYLPEDEMTERDYAILIEMTEKAGFEQYEISNFCRNGWISKHNSAYWQSVPYLGIGASAHSFNGASRKWNVAHLQQYIDGITSGQPYEETEILSQNNRYDEYVLLRLRTREGIHLNEISALFGPEKRGFLLSKLSQKVNPSHYILRDNQLTLSYSGKLFADSISMELFAEE